MKILAIVPARGGSKRLPRKNIKVLNGKPLIQWSIESALGNKDISKVMVSTDCQEIADIALQAGAEVPFIRPDSLATDTSSSSDVVRHALDYYKEKGEVFDFVLLLQPTSPIRNAIHNEQAINLLKDKKADAVVSVCECDHSPLWSNTLPSDLAMDHFIKDEIKNTRSQDLQPYYRLNGAIYLAKVSRFYEEDSLFLSSNIYAYLMDNESSVDIDHELDFLLAETVLKYKEKHA
ncbi:cytidylyltransferase domain-containing protein [Vibrio gallaecicus]|uniref:acylneuraminate cytidylyltransferase family protein n=1 Tax=Vibrio gallaecicus TaxID=552386 RepID=UPI0010C98131|nr:acylneuraminate cytidylyltransferase family protein [Vibrio gallaecicus]MDN3614788.1 acylneuraminate cytidylyltransferase family protein [Vibrio gallaecicus]